MSERRSRTRPAGGFARISLFLVCTALTSTALLPRQAAADAPGYATDELVELSLEDLANLTISSVSKKPERLSNAAASVFVITAEDIRRSGATSLPEALRLAPNLLVARIDADRYAISARGFNSETANKLQVLIDGRIVYTPLYSGVFWDIQDVVLEDVERIEVISGPGATTWGSNAVNGLINVITRPAADTRGWLVATGAGSQEQGAVLRRGGELGDDGHYRVYAKGRRYAETPLERGGDADDDGHLGQVGFRLDRPLNGQLTVQGDAYDGRGAQQDENSEETRGFNLLTRWQHPLEGSSRLQLQAYYDRRVRDRPGTFSERLDIFDIEAQHDFPWGERHLINWGLGYRVASDRVDNEGALSFLPQDKWLHWSNLFVQDEIQLQPDLRLTLGARLEHNRYTGLEVMPNVRLAWNPTPRDLLWASVARSVRTPSRLDRDLFIDAGLQQLTGGPDFESETADSIELGYRGNRSERFRYSATLFYHDYDDLRAIQPVDADTFEIGNGIEAEIYGLEAWAGIQATEGWRLGAGTLLQHQSLHRRAGSRATSQGNDPSQQWLLRSSLDLGPRHELDLTLRHVGKLPAPEVPAYTALDARLGWRPRPGVELSLTAWNLLDPEHTEFIANGSSEVERRVYAELLLRF